MPNNEIFVLDDDANVRTMLRIVLGKAGYDVLCFADETALFKVVRERLPACILLDIVLPERSGLEILDNLTEFSVPVIMISGHGDIPMAVEAIKRGAQDFIEKPFAGRGIVERLEAVLKEGRSRSSVPRLPIDARALASFTRRELQVFEHVAMGKSSKETGVALGISPRTVEEHRAKIMRKLGVRTTTELIMVALEGRNRDSSGLRGGEAATAVGPVDSSGGPPNRA